MSATRKLASVVIADVVGYSALMMSDEVGTLDRMRMLMTEIARPITKRFNGTVVKGTGDGWLAEFSSVTDAVLSSLEIQTELTERQVRTPKSRRLSLRIGVSLGEITFEDGDVYGTGVNLAARLESIAKPGGVCISDWVHEYVRSIRELRIEDMGVQALKNLDIPIRSYMVYRRAGGHKADPSPSPTATATLGGASIAVLPFANLSGDPEQEYFADGMVDDILTALARFKSLVVVARQSSFVYKGRDADIRQVGRELGVRYVLEGSVQRSGGRVRLTGQLIEAATGSHVWADRFEGEVSDIFDLQDRLTDEVVGILEPQIRRAEIERARRTRPDSVDAYDLYLRALPHAYAMRPADNSMALQLLTEAMALDPDYTPARVFAAWCYEQRLTRGWPTSQPDDAERAISLALETIEADTRDANALSLAGFILVMVGRRYEQGFAALSEAVHLNPYDVFVLMNAGWAEVFAGGLEKGQSLLERARSLSPRDSAAFYVITGLAMAHLLSGDVDGAVALASESAAVYADWDATFVVLTAALGHAGRIDDAKKAGNRLRQLLSQPSESHFLDVLPLRDPQRRALLEDGFRLAGMFD